MSHRWGPRAGHRRAQGRSRGGSEARGHPGGAPAQPSPKAASGTEEGATGCQAMACVEPAPELTQPTWLPAADAGAPSATTTAAAGQDGLRASVLEGRASVHRRSLSSVLSSASPSLQSNKRTTRLPPQKQAADSGRS